MERPVLLAFKVAISTTLLVYPNKYLTDATLVQFFALHMFMDGAVFSHTIPYAIAGGFCILIRIATVVYLLARGTQIHFCVPVRVSS